MIHRWNRRHHGLWGPGQSYLARDQHGDRGSLGWKQNQWRFLGNLERYTPYERLYTNITVSMSHFGNENTYSPLKMTNTTYQRGFLGIWKDSLPMIGSFIFLDLQRTHHIWLKCWKSFLNLTMLSQPLLLI